MTLLQNRAVKYGLAVGAIIVIALAFGYLFYKSIAESGNGEQFGAAINPVMTIGIPIKR